MDKADISPMETGKYLSLSRHRDVTEVVKISRNAVKIRCKDGQSANAILDSEIIKRDGYKTYIPALYTLSVGVARGIPTTWSDEEIFENCIASSRVVKVERMSFWDKENQISKPGTSIKISFRACKLPLEIKIYGAIARLSLFIPKPILCKNCFKYGHTATYCKVSKICSNCTDSNHADTDCKNPAKCNYCKENNNHKTSDVNCPESKVQADIKKIMVEEKIPFFEARGIVQKKVIEFRQNEETQKKSQYLITLKSQVDYNDTLLKSIMKLLLDRKSLTDPDESSKMINDIGRLMYSYSLKNSDSLITSNGSKDSTIKH